MVIETKLQSPYGQLDDCLKITNEQSAEVVYNFGDILELDREYTFSCWFRADSEIQISVQISNERSQYFPVTSEWQKVSFTASANTAKSKKVFFTIPANKTLYAYEGMLELGNIASDFKPSEKDMENVVTTLQTNFTVQQGKIEALIKDTTIDNGDGTTKSLKDAFNETKATVDGNTTTISNIKTSVDKVTRKVTSIDARITKVEQTADGITTTVTANKDKWDKASSDASNALNNSTQAKKDAENALNKAQDVVNKVESGELDGQDAIMLYIDSSNGTTFKNSDVATIFTVSIYVGGTIIDNSTKLRQMYGDDAYLQWFIKKHGEKDFTKIPLDDSRLNDNGFIFTIAAKDIKFKAVFNCELNI